MALLRASILTLAQEALQHGITQDQVIVGLQARIERDQRYLDRRKRSGQHTVYDDQTATDCALLALAVCWLMDDTTYHDLLALFVAVNLHALARGQRVAPGARASAAWRRGGASRGDAPPARAPQS